MIEDKLTRDERIRLECLAQSVASDPMGSRTGTQIINRAMEFEDYIRKDSR